MLRGAARSMLEWMLDRSGRLAQAERAMHTGLTILTYHRVLPDELALRDPLPHLVMPQSLFRAQVRDAAQRYEVVTFDQGLSRLAEPSTRARIAFTFDDGLADSLHVAATELEAAGLRGMFFIVAGLMDTDQELWFRRAARGWLAASARQRAQIITSTQAAASAGAGSPAGEPELRSWLTILKSVHPGARDGLIKELAGSLSPPDGLDRMMTREQVQHIRSRGHEVGSHTMTHPILPLLDDRELAHELGESRRLLGETLGHEVASVCYPNGDVDDRVVEASRAAGFVRGCTTRPGLAVNLGDPMRQPRVEIAWPYRVGSIPEFGVRWWRVRVSRARGGL